ncbi:MAG TPA: oxygenase MpaB family protein [Pseudonocardiaceae bacterium]|nr:oxygenase MpaB family protein [Pseudonocardiaceae bacterium]
MTRSTARVPADAVPDPGLVGPDSVTWQLHADPAMWVAGISGLFLQALHPRAVAGVVQNSNFRTDPLGRLVRTANFVGLSTYGTRPEVATAAAHVRRIHRGLRATDPRTGARFRVDEPDLLLWVHCAETWSFLEVLRRAGYPLTDRQADRYLDEQRGSATLVGLAADEVPGSRAAMREYFAGIRPELARTPESDVIYRFLHRPPVARALRPGLPVYSALIGHLAYSVLPDWAIRLHGRPGYPAPAATTMLRTIRLAALAVPTRVRWGRPEPYALRAIERLGRAATPSVRRLPTC